MKSALLKAGIAVIGILCFAEIAARLSGLTDVPAYAVDDGIGYVVRPNQSGRFLNKNSWAFNSKSMATEEEWAPARRPNIMIIGNSIVMGGNPYDQKDKLGPLISTAMGASYSVWPIAIGGWTNVNEMVYLTRHPDVVQSTKFFAWEYMSGGLSGLNDWRGDYVFPSKHPAWASWYAVRRYILPRFFTLNTNELPRTGSLATDHLKDFDASVSLLSKASGLEHPGVIFLYPTKKELRQARQSIEWLPERPALEVLSAKYGLTLIDVAQDPNWTESLYRDGTHPTVQGNVVLAGIISKAVRDTLKTDGL